ncbi:hypothetical protein DVU_0678 [Nitratidesulfovibrio vulgaris str. Hildenborough]|uniref:Uncharacterized protein n=1 Tax=Nitratidesulfovibrio vulgaris (strain ATCC 29579 / DSM 644 / CCUG 34227 / NCIMB 8303 / VKM B-1760 / Hildenborough) TaxID=882 RepID=Q72EA0_NITV2|nr:hypothetical protein DVU_0678 [Nitratidesulfovibrio vulgaris str. Hildenborough]
MEPGWSGGMTIKNRLLHYCIANGVPCSWWGQMGF